MRSYVQFFIFGLVAVLGALVAQVFFLIALSLFTGDTSIASLYDMDNILLALLLIGLSEEVFRGLLLWRAIVRIPTTSWLIASIFFGLGFASVEILGALFTGALVHVSPILIITTILLHIVLSIFLCFIIEKYRNIYYIGGAIILTTIVHSIYNGLIFFG